MPLRRRPSSNRVPVHYLRYKSSYPHALTLVLSLDATSDLTADRLSSRVQQVQTRFKDLTVRLVPQDATSVTEWESPCLFEDGPPWPSSDVLFHEPSDHRSIEDIMKLDLHRMEQSDLIYVPLWRVTLYTPTSSEGRIFLALSVWHLFTDGCGAWNLLRSLVTPSLQKLPHEPEGRFFLGQGPDLIIPLQPASPPKSSQEVPIDEQTISWPTKDQVLRHPMECTPEYTCVELPSSVISALKTLGKEEGVQTLNPTLLTCFTIALSSVIGRHANLKGVLPRSIRSTETGDSFISNSRNTNSMYDSSLLGSSSSFWERANSLQTYLVQAASQHVRQPTNVSKARQSAEDLHRSNLEYWTNVPFDLSFVFSNIAYQPWLDQVGGLQDVIWTQSQAFETPPLCVNLVGWKGGCRVSIGFYEGAILRAEEIHDLGRKWGEIARLVGEGSDNVDDMLESIGSGRDPKPLI